MGAGVTLQAATMFQAITLAKSGDLGLWHWFQGAGDGKASGFKDFCNKKRGSA